MTYKFSFLALLLLSGCAAQPVTTVPVSPAPSAEEIRQTCVGHIARTLAFAEVTEPVLDKCLAGSVQQCGLFAILLDRYQPQHDSAAAVPCLESGAYFGNLAAQVNTTLPRVAKKLARYNRLLAKS